MHFMKPDSLTIHLGEICDRRIRLRQGFSLSSLYVYSLFPNTHSSRDGIHTHCQGSNAFCMEIHNDLKAIGIYQLVVLYVFLMEYLVIGVEGGNCSTQRGWIDGQDLASRNGSPSSILTPSERATSGRVTWCGGRKASTCFEDQSSAQEVWTPWPKKNERKLFNYRYCNSIQCLIILTMMRWFRISDAMALSSCSASCFSSFPFLCSKFFKTNYIGIRF